MSLTPSAKFGLKPEIETEEAAESSTLLNVLYYFSIFALIVAIFGYFAVKSLVKSSEEVLNQEKSKISNIVSPSQKDKEKLVFETKKFLDDSSSVVENHRSYTNLFEFLEGKTHPNVWFAEFAVDSSDLLKVSGAAKNIESLARQMWIFKKEPLIKKMDLSNIFLTEDGEIKFSLEILFDPQLFKLK